MRALPHAAAARDGVGGAMRSEWMDDTTSTCWPTAMADSDRPISV
jgi:hypothetical protein